MPTFKTILVPTDFSPYSDNSIRYAQAFAEHSKGTVHFVHVIDNRLLEGAAYEGVYVSVGAIQQTLAAIREHAKVQMGHIEKKARARGLTIETHLLEGRPADEISALAEKINADLVVVATHGRSGLDRLVLGSNCEKLIRKATRPVLAVKHPEREFVGPDNNSISLKRILVPCDFSDFSKRAVSAAADLCREFKSTLYLTHVVDTWLDYPEFAPTVELNNSPFLTEKAKESLEKIAREQSGITTQIEVLNGVPHHGIVDLVNSESIDLVVMTTHGRAGFTHLLLGSVTEKVLRGAPCPVLILRPAK